MGLDKVQYQKQLRAMPLPALRRLEKETGRKMGGYGVAAGSGLGLALVTGGVSLIGAGYGAWKLSSHASRLKLIKAELAARHQKPHKVDVDDCLEPVFAFARKNPEQAVAAVVGAKNEVVAVVHAVEDLGSDDDSDEDIKTGVKKDVKKDVKKEVDEEDDGEDEDDDEDEEDEEEDAEDDDQDE